MNPLLNKILVPRYEYLALDEKVAYSRGILGRTTFC
jgi:hypothetical protein